MNDTNDNNTAQNRQQKSVRLNTPDRVRIIKTRIKCTAMNDTNDNNTAQNRRLLSTVQAATAWGITKYKIYDLVVAGKLHPIIGLGKGWKFRLNDFDTIEFSRL